MEYNPFERRRRFPSRGRAPTRATADSELTISASHTESCIRDTYRNLSPAVSESELGAAGGAPANTSSQTPVNTSTSGSEVHHHHHHHHHHYHHYGDFAGNDRPRSCSRERPYNRPYQLPSRTNRGVDGLPSYEEAVLENNTYVRHNRPQPRVENEDRTWEYAPRAARRISPIARPPYRDSERSVERNDRGFGRGRRISSPRAGSPRAGWRRVRQGATTSASQARPGSREESPDSRLGFTFNPNARPRPRRQWRTPQHSPEEPRSPERPAPEEDGEDAERGPRVETSASTSVASEPIGPSLPPSPYDIFADSLHLFGEQECWDDATSDSSSSYGSHPPDLETASESDQDQIPEISAVGRLILESRTSLRRGLLLALLSARNIVGAGPGRSVRTWAYLLASAGHSSVTNVPTAWEYAFGVDNAYDQVIGLIEGPTLGIFDLLGEVDPSVRRP